MSGRVRIGTCSDPADAAFVRSMFGARGIAIVIGAEHHASLLGPVGSAFLSLDIWVAEPDAEEASALLRDLREHDASEADAGDASTCEAADDRVDEEPHNAMQARSNRRRAIVAVMFGTFFTFGTAHLVTGAWLRGLALAAVEIVGMRLVATGDSLGIVAIVGAIVADLFGTIWRLRGASRPPLPMARVHGTLATKETGGLEPAAFIDPTSSQPR